MNQKYKKVITYSDGGARNNPGPAGIGVVIYDDLGNMLDTHKEFIGKATNNVAEYKALIAALKRVRKFDPQEVECRLDSELVKKQATGEYRVKDPIMKELLAEVRELTFFKNITFVYVPREQNKIADGLANEAMDEGTGLS